MHTSKNRWTNSVFNSNRVCILWLPLKCKEEELTVARNVTCESVDVPVNYTLTELQCSHLSSAALQCHICLCTYIVQVFLGSFGEFLSQDFTDKRIIEGIVSTAGNKKSHERTLVRIYSHL